MHEAQFGCLLNKIFDEALNMWDCQKTASYHDNLLSEGSNTLPLHGQVETHYSFL